MIVVKATTDIQNKIRIHKNSPRIFADYPDAVYINFAIDGMEIFADISELEYCNDGYARSVDIYKININGNNGSYSERVLSAVFEYSFSLKPSSNTVMLSYDYINKNASVCSSDGNIFKVSVKLLLAVQFLVEAANSHQLSKELDLIVLNFSGNTENIVNDYNYDFDKSPYAMDKHYYDSTEDFLDE